MLAGIITVLLILVFLGGVAWVWSSKRQPEFDAASRLPLDDERENIP